MEKCKNCKFWDMDTASAFYDCAHHPCNNKKIDIVRATTDLAVVGMLLGTHEGVMVHPETHPEFGCVCWEPRK